MILLFKYILLSSLLISTLHGQRKGKRDLADLSNDPVLSSIFSSDVKEKRPDRSISLQEDILTNKHEKSKNEQLASILFPDRYQQRRDTDPVSELMSLNKNKKAVKKTLEPNLLENNIKNTVPGQTDNNIKNVKPLISESSVVEPIASKFNTPIKKQNMIEQQLAVNPALFASNYLPLPGSNYPEQHNSMPVTKKDTIIYPQTNPVVVDMSMDQNNNKKSIIPPSSFVTSDVKPPKIGSFPVELRVHSPNMKLRGVVPHITEYGETVQSVQEFQRMVNYKKNTIPQPMYSNEIYKKNDIPQPPSSHQATIKKYKQEKRSKTSKSKSVKKSTSSTKKSMTKKQQKVKSTKENNREQKRQYLPQPYAPQQLIPQNQQFIAQNQYYQPSVANYQQQNPFSIQQSALEFKAPQVQQNTAQVQNMDGLFTRPIITEEACADQYTSCVDFAKNNYCKNYPDLMKIQCRKSCSYCVPPASSPVNSTSQNANATVDSGDETQDSDSGDSDSGSGSGSEDWKASAVRTITAIGNKRHDVLQERIHNQGINSGSGNPDESGSGSEESGSTSNDDDENKVLIPVVNNIKTSNTNNARNKISFPKILRKIDLGDFVLPVKKSEIPMLPLHVIAAHLNHADTSDLDDASDNGSGSGSGDSGDESGSESGESEAPKKSVVTKESTHYSKIKASPTAKKSMPAKPSLPGVYPKIDLRAIASALANYEEAALQLAGEYPKPASVDITDYTRSIIPHPENKEQIKLNKLKQNIQIAKLLTEERIRKGTIPKFLKLTKDAIKSKEDEKDPLEADSVDSVRQRFIIPGMEPTLNDYYAETGRMNPYGKKKKTVKKSRIEAMKKNISEDPYEYLRNMPDGASMEPIVDPQARSTIPSDHSYPVFLMKVSPADEKYLPESPVRRGMVRNLDAEGLPVKPAVVAPKPAEIAPSSFVPYETPEPKPVTIRQPLPPALFEAPQAPPQEQAQIFQPSINYNNIEQESAPRASAAFANEESVGVPERQPGTGSLRSKMLSAFFSVKNDGLEEGSGGGSGYGITNGNHQEPSHSSESTDNSVSEAASRKSISLHNLLFNENPQHNEEGSDWSVPSGKTANLRILQASSAPQQSQDASANYLQSNLAALTPENGNPNFEAQSGLTSGRLGAQFTLSKMSKTQETNWVRPNAESELASAMPESSTGVERSSHAVPAIEHSALTQPILHKAFKDQAPELRNVVPKIPIIKKKASSKTIIPASIFSGRHAIEPQTLSRKSLNDKLLSREVFNTEKTKTFAPNIAITSLKDDVDKSVLMDFPKSPFTSILKETIFGVPQLPQVPLIQAPPNNNVMSFNSKLYNNAITRNNIYQQPPAAYSWRQYMPFSTNVSPIPQMAPLINFPATNMLLHNEQASPLMAGSARYQITRNLPGIKKSFVTGNVAVTNPAITNLAPVKTPVATETFSEISSGTIQQSHNPTAVDNSRTNPEQYAGWNYIVPPPANIRPLVITTSETNEGDKTPIRKNLIKQRPDLDCGDNWEGTQGDFGTFCYKEMQMKATFDDSLAECRRLKGDLFSVLNAYENRYLQDNTHEKFWIGYRDKGMDGNWNWTDGSRGIYTNWGSEADDDNGQRHDCVFIDGEEGEWKDESCSKKQSYLCKKKAESCPKDWKNLKLNSVNGCYKLFDDPQSWEDAEQQCEKEKAHLASVASDDEQTMVFQVHSSKYFWIGFNDKESEGDWQWVDRTTSSYTNWAEKSPDNGGVSCASMVEGGKWHDEPCTEKLKFICKKKGPKPEKLEGLDNDGVLLPMARLLTNAETAPSHVYDDLAKSGPRPVVPIYFWPLLKTSKSGMAGNRPMAPHGDVRSVPGGVALDGEQSFLDGGDFHGKCIAEPDKCQKGFAVAVQVFFDDIVRKYKEPHYIVDTSGGGKGFSISIENNKLVYKVIRKDEMWELKTDFTTGRWQEIVMSWHRGKGIFVYVNGAFEDSETVGKKSEVSDAGTTRLIVGRENKEKGPYTCTRMVVASLAIFTKVLTIEDVPYAFTYGDTVVASYRWLMSAGIQDSIVPGAPDIETRKLLVDVDGGIYVDGNKGWVEIDDFDPVFADLSKAKHGFAFSFKVKFDQRVRDYKEPKYVLDTGGHNGGVKGISVYLVNDNLYFQVINSPDEDIMIWKVRVPIYTVRWQRIVMTWRLDKGLWVYIDGAFRGYTKIPITLPEQAKDTPKRFLIGRKTTGPNYAGAQFAFGSLAVYNRFLSRQDTEKVFGGIDSPFPGIIREIWKNTPGENLTSLKSNPDYPNNPTTIEIIENYDAPFNVDLDYGSKLKGYFIAPETGNNTFYLSCSKACELYFSSDEEAKNKTRIISLSKATWHNQWNKYENQSSAEIFLVAGKYYYLEAVHKGVDASDSLSVGVRMPTGRYQRPISKENLQWRLPGNLHAGLVREVWYDVPGYTIADLTSNINFPTRSSSTEILDKFDAPFNVDDNYGSRISGYFHAPETGDFRFYLSTDSSGELWISSDDSENNLVKVVTLNGWTDHNQWLKYPEQKSDKIFLAAGRYYFTRVYMKADKLGDCASVAVELPSGHFEGPIKKKHLSWKLVGNKEGPGPKEIVEVTPKPVGLFALNDASVKDILLPGDNKLILGDVDLTSGPGGLKDDAFLFKGNKSSYIEIPNTGQLDTKRSITLLANVYPMGEDGPIINYKTWGWGVHLWQFSKTQLFVRFVTRDGKMNTQPLGTRVLELNKWNQVGASYDNNTGVAQLWHDGKMVKSRNIGQIELLTNAPIRLGAREGDDRYYKGKISCVQIYDRALKEEQIGDLRRCPKKLEKGSQSSIDNDELTIFAPGSGIQPSFEEYETLANQIGDDTEEELIVEGEKNKASQCDPNPCKNNGVCQDDDKRIDGFTCTCTSDFTGKHCQVSKPAAQNPAVKRTNIPSTYEKKESTETYTSVKSRTNGTFASDKNPDESKEDISLLYQKLGCYKDDPKNRDLKTHVKLTKPTQEDCVKACALEDKSFAYFGLQSGNECFCGKKYGKYGKVSDDDCNLRCKGNDEQNCGGKNASNVFFFGLGTNYTVKTFTGRKFGAGTDAKIYVEFIGERGSSDFRQLDSRLEKYESGSVDQQTFLLPDLGRLTKMKVLHDNTGTAPSWFLNKIQVSDEEGSNFEFLCNDWLSDTQSGGKLERELSARSIVPSPT